MKFIDTHIHIAWDIDDGIPSKEDAIKTLKNAKQDGINMIIATPHYVPGTYSIHDVMAIDERLDDTIALANEYQIEVFKGSEVFLNNEYLDMVDAKMFHTLANSNYILVEFDVRKDIKNIEGVEEKLYELTIRNYRPIIAHVERYFHSGIDLKRVREWIKMGCFVQVNRTSILGLGGEVCKQNAQKLLKAGVVHIVASDTHRATGNRICKFSDVYEYIAKKYVEKNADLLCKINPENIILNKELDKMEMKKGSLISRILRRGE